MEYLKEFHKGKQDILEKVRPNGDTKINNKSVTNYAWEFVSFKKGYYVGKPIKYVDLNEEQYDDIKYLNRYNRNIKKASKDLTKYENMFITGIAHTMTIPKRTEYNPETQSPYEYNVLDNKDVCVVRSSDINKTKLFSMCISKMFDKEDKIYYIYTIYYGNNCMQIQNLDGKLSIINISKMPINDCITEYQLNEQRMGLFEVVISNMNSLNKMNSNQLDQHEENVNSYLTFENVDVESITDNIDNFREKRILVVETNNPETPAKIGIVNVNTDQNPINDKYKEMEQRMYDIVGVPMPTSSTGQGVSGEAQVYGGGWENAQVIALVDTGYILQFEEEDLEKFIFIAQDVADTKIPNIIASDIEVKYTINKSNNMMVKAQSMTYFIDKGFTREQALTYCEITDDPQTEGKIADDNYINQKRLDTDLEIEKTEKINQQNAKYQSNQEQTNE